VQNPIKSLGTDVYTVNLEVRRVDKFSASSRIESVNAQTVGKPVFQYGNEYFLSEAWTPGSKSWPQLALVDIEARIDAAWAERFSQLAIRKGMVDFCGRAPAGDPRHQSTGLSDENVSGSEQGDKGDEGNDDTPGYAGPLFLNCCLKHV
jgi:hypothetical protein